MQRHPSLLFDSDTNYQGMILETYDMSARAGGGHWGAKGVYSINKIVKPIPKLKTNNG
jgi:hypothetical protein